MKEKSNPPIGCLTFLSGVTQDPLGLMVLRLQSQKWAAKISIIGFLLSITGPKKLMPKTGVLQPGLLGRKKSASQYVSGFPCR